MIPRLCILGSSCTCASLRTALLHPLPGPGSATSPLASFFNWEDRLWGCKEFRSPPWLAFALASSHTCDHRTKAFSSFFCPSSTEGAWGCHRQQDSWLATGWHCCPSVPYSIPDQHSWLQLRVPLQPLPSVSSQQWKTMSGAYQVLWPAGKPFQSQGGPVRMCRTAHPRWKKCCEF